MRPGAQSGFPNAVSSEFNRHTFASAHAQNPYSLKQENLVPPGLEPGTFRVLSERDNHYTMELHAAFPGDTSDYKPEHGSLLPKITILML